MIVKHGKFSNFKIKNQNIFLKNKNKNLSIRKLTLDYSIRVNLCALERVIRH